MRTQILCQIVSCNYHVFKEDEGEAYQHQCENDEIEIDMSSSGIPQCFSYEQIDT